MYSIGRRLAGKMVLVRCDPVSHEWVFFEPNPFPEQEQTLQEELAPRPIKNLDVDSLTGLEPIPIVLSEPIQLTLPCLAA